jgi:hypothetical protein
LPFVFVEPPKTFRRVLNRKSNERVSALLKAMAQMEQDLWHPSLRTSKLTGRPGQWYSRASRSDRITFYLDGNRITPIMNCGHDIL